MWLLNEDGPEEILRQRRTEKIKWADRIQNEDVPKKEASYKEKGEILRRRPREYTEMRKIR